jgi:anti-sigma factor (TIGR02949 family)
MIEAHPASPTAGTLNCTEAVAILWDYLDGELSAAREAAMRAHLEACRPCLRHHEFERAFLDAVATARTSDPAPPALRSRVVDMLRAQGLLP